jgi:hypothetical protein
MLLGWIAGEMLVKEEAVSLYVPDNTVLHYFFSLSGALLVLAIGKLKGRFVRENS